jgi:hypothetical protein
MRKLTINEAITLLRLHEGSLDFLNVSPDDFGVQNALVSLAEIGLVDAYDIEQPLTEEGRNKAHQMLAYGINYDRHFEHATIKAKRAAFLALINSGYESRGLMRLIVNKLSPISFSELKKAVYDRTNLSLGTNQRPARTGFNNSSRRKN